MSTSLNDVHLHLHWKWYFVILLFQEFLELDELQYDRMTRLNPRSGEKGIIANSVTAAWDKVSVSKNSGQGPVVQNLDEVIHRIRAC